MANLTVFIGTKAQFIKMVPLILEFQQRGWPCRIVDTGQHARLVRQIIEQFGLREPDHSLDDIKEEVTTIPDALGWSMRLVSKLLRSGPKLRNEFFGGRHGVCFIHGDTMSTLLSALLARRAGQKIVHVEAGLRSYNYFHPFPEEIVRVIVMHMADFLFAPSETAYSNLAKMGLSKKAYLTPGNTNIDTLRLTLSLFRPLHSPVLPEGYCLATIHRLETLFSRSRLEKVFEILIKAHRTAPLVFIVHPPTEKRLKHYNLYNALKRENVTILPLQDHATFIRILRNARFILTDGGSIQEEASYLGIPCLLLRKKTEREEGIGKNVVLSGLDTETIDYFLENFETFRRKDLTMSAKSPSGFIADTIEVLARTSLLNSKAS